MQIHVVQRGETLWQIADYYNVNIQDIVNLNGLNNPNILLPGHALLIPTNDNTYGPKPEIDVNAFTYFLGMEGVPIVREAGHYLTYLSPFAYLINEDGSLVSIADEPEISEAYSKGTVPVMVIVNFAYGVSGENIAHAVLNNPDTVNTLQENIINTMKDKGYQGLNLDFEYVFPEDREAYNSFLESTANRLHNEGFFISTSLAPKISAEQSGLLYEAHDYLAHGRLTDFIVLMTYEWGWSGGYPRAISPINEIKRVLDYAVTVMPRDKILMGFQLYARDWKIPFEEGQRADTISIQEAMDIAYEHMSEIQYDYVSQSPYFHYTDAEGNAHEVWFEDARSVQAKFDIMKEYGLRGISYWGLGYEFPQNFPLLAHNFQIRKL